MAASCQDRRVDLEPRRRRSPPGRPRGRRLDQGADPAALDQEGERSVDLIGRGAQRPATGNEGIALREDLDSVATDPAQELLGHDDTLIVSGQAIHAPGVVP